MSHVEVIRKNNDILLRCTTINFYVIDYLRAEDVLDEPQEHELKTKRNPLKQRILLFQWLKEVSSDRYESFLQVMKDTEQEHVANLLTGSIEEDHLPLSDARYRRLVKIRPRMANVTRIDSEVIADLRSLQAISMTDAEEIRAESVDSTKVSKLISVIMRRSNHSYNSFQDVLRNTLQTAAANFLREGEMPAVHVKNKRPDLDRPLAHALNAITRNGTTDDAEMKALLGDLNRLGLNPVNAIPGQSIVIYIYCQTVDNAVRFTQLFNSGRLQYVLESILNRLLLIIEPHNKEKLDSRIYMEDEEIVILEEFTGIEDWMQESSSRPKPLRKIYGCDAITQTDEEPLMKKKIAQLEQLTLKLEETGIAFVTQESHVIRSNHQFLVENIQSSRLIDLLLEKNCITAEERDHLNKQPTSLIRNDALLQWMRTILFEQDKGQKVLECFRQTDQNFIPDLVQKGGVLVKSKILAKLVKRRLFAKWSSKNLEELKEKEVMVMERLNQLQGLSLSDSQNLTSENRVDDIVIAPFCHQESDGIVIWFWCQSNNGQQNLQSMHESGILLKKLISIFKEFSNVSNLLVPTGITILMGDFTTNKNIPTNVAYSPNPTRVHTIKTQAAEANDRSIKGTSILNNELFIISQLESEVEVYDCTTLAFRRKWLLTDLLDPDDATSCVRNRCLYISDNKAAGKGIFRVDVDGNIISQWPIGEESGRLSVTNQSTVILSLHDSSRLVEYSADGLLIREVKLFPAGLTHPMHAVRLANGNFVITQGYLDNAIHRVCEVSPDGRYLRSFGAEKGSGSGHLTNPTYLAVDREGSIMVADAGNGRVILIGSNFEYKRELITKNNGLHIPTRICLDEINGRLYVAEYKRDMRSLLVFNVR